MNRVTGWVLFACVFLSFVLGLFFYFSNDISGMMTRAGLVGGFLLLSIVIISIVYGRMRK